MAAHRFHCHFALFRCAACATCVLHVLHVLHVLTLLPISTGISAGWHHLKAYATDPLNGTDVVGVSHRFYIDDSTSWTKITPLMQQCVQQSTIDYSNSYHPPKNIQGMEDCLAHCKLKNASKYRYAGAACHGGHESEFQCKCVGLAAYKNKNVVPKPHSECLGGTLGCGAATHGTFVMGGADRLALYDLDDSALPLVNG